MNVMPQDSPDSAYSESTPRWSPGGTSPSSREVEKSAVTLDPGRFMTLPPVTALYPPRAQGALRCSAEDSS